MTQARDPKHPSEVGLEGLHLYKQEAMHRAARREHQDSHKRDQGRQRAKRQHRHKLESGLRGPGAHAEVDGILGSGLRLRVLRAQEGSKDEVLAKWGQPHTCRGICGHLHGHEVQVEVGALRHVPRQQGRHVEGMLQKVFACLKDRRADRCDQEHEDHEEVEIPDLQLHLLFDLSLGNEEVPENGHEQAGEEAHGYGQGQGRHEAIP
mmetsp:Transcript_43684/g.81454  ORF Transcript_43684/g.81454 Transcript_43684/m.81454 type:complete len:207 (-) Transcript_43684:1569-2189(-)